MVYGPVVTHGVVTHDWEVSEKNFAWTINLMVPPHMDIGFGNS